MLSGRVTKIPSLSPLLSKDEGLRDTGHIMSNGNLILGVNSVTVSYLIHDDGLLQNAADMITKCDSHFITKSDRVSLQNASGFYCKMGQFCYKMWQLLQIAIILLQMRCLLQIATVQYLRVVYNDKNSSFKERGLRICKS